jgi:acyl-CoA synthetase (NDP forming)
MSHPYLKRIVSPRSIAFVGANDKVNSGARAMKMALALGFEGAIYPVNPNYESVQGLRCYPRLDSLPEIPDLAVVSAPGAHALDLLDQAEKAGVKAALFFASGFTDEGTPEGRARNEHLLTVARRSDMAIGGPNCMGVMSLKRRFNASFVSTPGLLKAGGISIVSQSGGLINAFVELGFARDLGFNYLISTGNEAVMETADYLDWLADDPDTKVIISTLEAVKTGARYRAALARACRVKPVVVVKLGRTEEGKQATIAHTGNLAGDDATFAALCRQCGASLVDTLDEALETAALFDSVPLPKGKNVVIFSTSGGATGLTTDLGVRRGLHFPPLSPETNAAMQRIFEAKKPFINPFDVGSSPLLLKGDNATQCVETLLADDAVDVIACVLIINRDIGKRTGIFDQLRPIALRAEKPILLMPEMTLHWREKPPGDGLYVAGALNDGLTAIRALVDYGDFRRRAEETIAPEPARLMIERPPGQRLLTEYESKQILAQAGLPTTREALTKTANEAAAAAERIGFPVALKLQSPDLTHKSDVGGVRLKLASAEAVRGAFTELSEIGAAQKGARIDGVLVQEMVAGVEMMLGMKRDPIFGPVVVVSPGGVFVELFESAAAIALPPFGQATSEGLVAQSQPMMKLLDGFRGAPPADRAAFIKLIDTFAAFVLALPEHVVAIDLNPVMVLPEGRGVRIVDARIEFSQ